MLTVLGFDCGGAACSAALLRDGQVAARRAAPMERGQAEALMPMIAAVLEEARCRPDALDLVAVTVGPGAFTGLRIGLAAARGLALATGRPVAGVSSFAAVAAAVRRGADAGHALVVALESRREEFYLQAFSAEGTALGAGALVPAEKLATRLPAGKLLLAGDAAERLVAALGDREVALAPDSAAPDPAIVARLGAADWRAGRALPPEPVYLRAPDTTAPPRARSA